MTHFRHTLRWRIQLWHGLLLATVVAGCCYAMWKADSAQRLQNARSELRAQVITVVRSMPPPRPPGSGPPPDARTGTRTERMTARLNGYSEAITEADSSKQLYYVVWHERDQTISKSQYTPEGIQCPEVDRDSDAGTMERTTSEAIEAFFITPTLDCFLVGRSLQPLREADRTTAIRLAAIGAAVIVCGLLVGWWITGQALRPIGEIAETARHIAQGDLSDRIPEHKGGSEIDQLSGVLNETFDKLESAFEQQQQFTADAAHELRTPISVILTQAQTALNREREPAFYQEVLGACVNAARRLQRLSENLLQLSAFDNKSSASAPRERCDLAAIIEVAADQLQPLAAKRRIAICNEAAETIVQADRDAIEQVAVNLLANAVQYSDDDQSVTIRCGRDADEVAYLTVLDRGAGIAEAELPHLFDRFYRAEYSRDRHRGGAGLGLAICQQIADNHGATLEVESQVGEGSQFTLRFARDKSA